MNDDGKSVLVLGANGNLGSRVVRALAARAPGKVVAAVRDGDAQGTWERSGVRTVRADLADAASLAAALSGVRTVISAVQGERDVIVDGQMRLLEAALVAGVERIIPSDFSIDARSVPPGINPNLDLRNEFADTLKASGMGWTIFLNGGFTDVMTAPFFGMIDADRRTVSYWGDGDTAMDLTTMNDAAALVAAVALDRETLGRTVRFAGDEISARGMLRALATATGVPWEERRLGSIEAGYAHLDRLRSEGVPFLDTLSLVYGLPMMSGAAKLQPLDNGRYPDVQLTTVERYLRATRPADGTGSSPAS